VYIVNNEKIPMSLLNLCLSSLHQNKLNWALNPSKSILPKTLCQQTPPCYIFHINPFDLTIKNIDYCCNYHISSHISDW